MVVILPFLGILTISIFVPFILFVIEVFLIIKKKLNKDNNNVSKEAKTDEEK